jgi:drug/metabolite transporter (DMT)-like permease
MVISYQKKRIAKRHLTARPQGNYYLSIKKSYIAELALVGIAAVWGLTFPMVQDAVAVLPVTAFLAYRFTAAAIVVALVSRKEIRGLSGEGWRAGVAMGVFLTAGYLLQTLGLERTSSSNTGFITGMFVVLTPILGFLLLGHRAGPLAWGAAVISACGLLLLSGVGGNESHLVGDALVLLCACSFSAHILVTDIAVRSHDVRALLVVQLLFCGVVCGLLAALSGDLVVPREASAWSALAVTAFVASALGFFVQTYAQRHASPARTALILASEPAFAGLFAYLLKNETLSPMQWAGALLILVSIVSVVIVPYLRPLRPLPEG